MTIFERITEFVQQVFKTNLEVFLSALKMSPNAQGYMSGSISELLLKEKLESEGYEVLRIREKWEGRKHSRHHGDFYFRKRGSDPWYVLESKGVKSNSEKWHKLYNYDNLRRFLIQHADKLPWMEPGRTGEEQVVAWVSENLPRFQNEYAANLYEYQEVQAYSATRQTEKAAAIAALRGFTRDEINAMIDERLAYVLSKVAVLETHFVSGTSGSNERTQATPRADEFNLIAIDIALRYPEHRFLFANPQNLERSGGDADHLQQNYVMGFLWTDQSGHSQVTITDEWSDEIDPLYRLLKPADAVMEADMQVDVRLSERNGKNE
ncbi:MAG TPA: hypothetical protein PL105_19115 [Caldilineaceae bacterium]|nr:hypothetical protein [Caldilineaceae bacterium]